MDGDGLVGVGAKSALEYSVRSLSFSPDGHWLCLASTGSRVYLYDIDRFCIEWALPLFVSPVTHASFSPLNTLVVLLANNSLHIYDPQRHQSTDWSARNSAIIPSGVRDLPSPLEGIAFDAEKPNMFFLFGQGTGVFLDLTLEVPDRSQMITALELSASHNGEMEEERGIGERKRNKRMKKRKKNTKGNENANFTTFTQYRSIVHMSVLSGSELVRKKNRHPLSFFHCFSSSLLLSLWMCFAVLFVFSIR